MKKYLFVPCIVLLVSCGNSALERADDKNRDLEQRLAEKEKRSEQLEKAVKNAEVNGDKIYFVLPGVIRTYEAADEACKELDLRLPRENEITQQPEGNIFPYHIEGKTEVKAGATLCVKDKNT